MKSLSVGTIVFLCSFHCVFSQTTFYSRNATSGGSWSSASSWTLNADGSGGAAGIPGRTSNVVILSGHTITISATNANGSTGMSADALARPDVGGFTSSGVTNFYQTGNKGGLKEEPAKENDHSMDAGRYMVAARDLVGRTRVRWL